jgi:hypothetical protein
VGRPERDQGLRPAPTSEERERIKALERENRELRQTNAILRKASAYFARGARRAELANAEFPDFEALVRSFHHRQYRRGGRTAGTDDGRYVSGRDAKRLAPALLPQQFHLGGIQTSTISDGDSSPWVVTCSIRHW